MATIGQQLLQPESGWRRYDNNDNKFLYTGAWNKNITTEGTYNGAYSYTSTTGDTIKFKFYGTKLRIIAAVAGNRAPTTKINIDGNDYTYNQQYGTNSINQALLYEINNLSFSYHTVIITTQYGGYTGLDAIDIDDTGCLSTIVGQQLTVPEPGWRRYDEMDANITYLGNGTINFILYNNASNSGGSILATNSDTQSINCKIKFNFTGTKLILIAFTNPSGYRYSDNIQIKIDNVIIETFSEYTTSQQFQTLVYEKIGLDNTEHFVEITNMTNYAINLDAIDIDNTGELLSYNSNLRKYLIKSYNYYYSIKPDYYNITNKMYIPLTLSDGSIPNTQDIQTFGFDDINQLNIDMTINDETFKPIDKLFDIFEIKKYES